MKPGELACRRSIQVVGGGSPLLVLDDLDDEGKRT